MTPPAPYARVRATPGARVRGHVTPPASAAAPACLSQAGQGGDESWHRGGSWQRPLTVRNTLAQPLPRSSIKQTDEMKNHLHVHLFYYFNNQTASKNNKAKCDQK